jgi:hypothetical protein
MAALLCSGDGALFLVVGKESEGVLGRSGVAGSLLIVSCIYNMNNLGGVVWFVWSSGGGNNLDGKGTGHRAHASNGIEIDRRLG